MKEIDFIFENFPTGKSLSQDSFTGKYFQAVNEKKITQIVHKCLQFFLNYQCSETRRKDIRIKK